MSFLIMTFHAVSATIPCQSCPFCHFCHFIWSADDRDIVLFMGLDDGKVCCVHLSRHPSFKFASERVSLLFCSFEKKSSPKNCNFCIERLQYKRQFLVTMKFTSTLQMFFKMRDLRKMTISTLPLEVIEKIVPILVCVCPIKEFVDCGIEGNVKLIFKEGKLVFCQDYFCSFVRILESTDPKLNVCGQQREFESVDNNVS